MSELIKDSELSIRAQRCLASEGIKTFDQLIEKTEGEVMRIRNVGVGTLEGIKTVLENRNCKLRQPMPRSRASALWGRGACKTFLSS